MNKVFDGNLTNLYRHGLLLKEILATQLSDAEKYEHWLPNQHHEEYRGVHLEYLANSRKNAKATEEKLASVREQWSTATKGMAKDIDYFVDNGLIYIKEIDNEYLRLE